MYVDMVTVEAVDCLGIENEEITVSDIKSNQATFTWQDDRNTQWEYYVQAASGTVPPTPPTGSGTKTAAKSVTVYQTTAGANLQPDTEYEFWVRTNCGNGTGIWVLANFKTLCGNPIPFPFWEGFNTDSPTVSCWTIIDVNGDADDITVSNKWRIFRDPLYEGSFYEGDGGASFFGNGMELLDKEREHDDWLISPTFVLDPTKYYRLKYHYQTNIKYRNEFSVWLSTQGVDPVNFTRELISKQGYSDDNWNEKTVIFSGNGLAGEVNIGWHLTTKEVLTQNVNIDNVFLEEVDCPEPFDLQTKDKKEDSVILSWTEDFGTNWEYYVQKADGSVPAGSGTPAAVKEVTVTADKDGTALEPNTEYEFYVRTDCGKGKYSTWTGPYSFRTSCQVFDTPFWEGFNVSSPTLPCWTVVNANDDFTRILRYQNYWVESSVAYEGSGSMRFYGSSFKIPHDDWLISPAIKFEAGKTYRLKYHYQTTSQDKLGGPTQSEFEVLLSDSGPDINQFTTTVVPRKKYNPGEKWKEEYVFISGVSGEINIAWHVISDINPILYVDNVFVEEVQGCPEPFPITLGAKDEQSNSAVIFWDDDRGATQWEYYVQEKDKGIPAGSGTQTSAKENTAVQEQSDKALEPNTTYEFYVRTDCGNGAYSIWQGPYLFTTACGTYTTPFWEDFNTDSQTLPCWEVIDQNGDATSPTGVNIWLISSTIVSGMPQKEQRMNFSGSLGKTHDDWLISPTIAMDPVLYVLKYKYYTPDIANYNNSFEVLLSSAGTDPAKFTTTIVPTKIYQEGIWKEEIVYFTGVRVILIWPGM